MDGKLAQFRIPIEKLVKFSAIATKSGCARLAILEKGRLFLVRRNRMNIYLLLFGSNLGIKDRCRFFIEEQVEYVTLTFECCGHDNRNLGAGIVRVIPSANTTRENTTIY